MTQGRCPRVVIAAMSALALGCWPACGETQATLGDAGPGHDHRLLDAGAGRDGATADDHAAAIDAHGRDAGARDRSGLFDRPTALDHLVAVDAPPPDASAGDRRGSDGTRADATAGPDRATADAGPVLPLGVNLPNLLHLYLGSAPGDASTARQILDRARAAGVTHVRFIASGYWPVDMTTGSGWNANPTAFFAAFDQLIADARARGIRLVPSLLWHLYLFPDIVGAPTGDLLTPGTATRTLAEQYISAVVGRYAGSDAILFWELGNELNLMADLDVSSCGSCDGASENCGSIAPSLGTPCRRRASDNIFSCNSCRGVSSAQQDLGQFAESIALLVRGLDPAHGFSSGHGYPRLAAWHLGHSPCPACDWSADSVVEYEQALAQLHPVHVDVVSVHHYFGADVARFGDADQVGVALLQRTRQWAHGHGKQLYVGEYGEVRAGSVDCGGVQQCGGDPERAATRRLLDAFVVDQVPYSAIWALDFFQFCANVPTCYTVTADEPIVAELDRHNQAFAVCAGQGDGVTCPLGRCQGGICTPVRLGAFSFDSVGDENQWTIWTNCSSCTAGTGARVTTADGGLMRLTSYDLPCTTGCAYPGVYALSPAIAAQPGHLLAVFQGASAATASFKVVISDGASTELQQSSVPFSDGSGLPLRGLWVELPANTGSIRIRLELSSAYGVLDLDEVWLDWQP